MSLSDICPKIPFKLPDKRCRGGRHQLFIVLLQPTHRFYCILSSIIIFFRREDFSWKMNTLILQLKLYPECFFPARPGHLTAREQRGIKHKRISVCSHPLISAVKHHHLLELCGHFTDSWNSGKWSPNPADFTATRRPGCAHEAETLTLSSGLCASYKKTLMACSPCITPSPSIHLQVKIHFPPAAQRLGNSQPVSGSMTTSL